LLYSNTGFLHGSNTSSIYPATQVLSVFFLNKKVDLYQQAAKILSSEVIFCQKKTTDSLKFALFCKSA